MAVSTCILSRVGAVLTWSTESSNLSLLLYWSCQGTEVMEPTITFCHEWISCNNPQFGLEGWCYSFHYHSSWAGLVVEPVSYFFANTIIPNRRVAKCSSVCCHRYHSFILSFDWEHFGLCLNIMYSCPALSLKRFLLCWEWSCQQFTLMYGACCLYADSLSGQIGHRVWKILLK